MATLHLSDAVLMQLREHCQREYPREACGLLLGELKPREGKGPKRMVTRLVEGRNVAVADQGVRFVIDPVDLVRADSIARDAGLEVLGAYHSHPDREEVPSSLDGRDAQPGWSHLIVRVNDGQAVSERCWAPDGSAFAEERICVC